MSNSPPLRKERMFDFTAVVQDDVLVSPGVDWGGPLRILHRKGDCVVVRAAGHMAWDGNYSPRKYVGPLYMLVRLKTRRIPATRTVNNEAYTQHYAEGLREVTPGRQWRNALADLCKLCDTEGT